MVRELTIQDAEAYVAVRRKALIESPFAFASSPDDDIVSSTEAVCEQLRRTPDSTILGAFRPNLIGTVGIYRNRHTKSSHKAHIWGMYVVPGHRRQGIGSELLQGALSHARKLQGVSWVYLSVSSAAPEAKMLYENFGFQVWGTEPAALRHDGRTVTEHHMAFCLD
jgi:ribosomal protein S18 acetylase RimI-like enzyme